MHKTDAATDASGSRSSDHKDTSPHVNGTKEQPQNNSDNSQSPRLASTNLKRTIDNELRPDTYNVVPKNLTKNTPKDLAKDVPKRLDKDVPKILDNRSVSGTNGGKSGGKGASPTVVTPPDGGWGWVIVFSSFFISVLVDGVCFSFGIFFDDLREEFNTSKSTTSWIGSVLNGSYLIFGPIVSALVNLYGCQRITLCGALLATVSFFLSTFSTNIGTLIFTFGFLGGVGFGLMYLPAIVMVGYYFERRRALATGIACCGSGIGAFVFAPLSEFLLHQYDWRGAIWILSALVFHGLLFAAFYRPLTATTTGPTKQDVENGIPQLNSEETVPMLVLPEQVTSGGIDVEVVELVDNTSKDVSPGISQELKNSILHRLKLEDMPGGPVFRQRSMTLSSCSLSDNSKRLSPPNDLLRLAYSQDLGPLIANDSERMRSRGGRGSNPLNRKDTFFGGSLWHLKEYQEVSTMEEFREHMQVSSVSEIEDNPTTVSGKLRSLLRAILDVFELSVMKSPTFLIYGSSCFLCMAGFFVPFVYMPTHAIELGFDSTSAALLISIIGITNTVGRVGVGFVSDMPRVDCLLFNNIALIIGGAVTLFVPFYASYALLALYSVIFGAAIAVFVSLRSIIMVELMGLDKLTTAFGFVIMCQGLSSLLGAPLAGALSDYTGNYNAAFYMAGITLTLSGVICLPLRRIARWEAGREGSKILGGHGPSQSIRVGDGKETQRST